VEAGLVLRAIALVVAIALGRVAWTSRGGRRVAAIAGTLGEPTGAHSGYLDRRAFQPSIAADHWNAGRSRCHRNAPVGTVADPRAGAASSPADRPRTRVSPRVLDEISCAA